MTRWPGRQARPALQVGRALRMRRALQVRRASTVAVAAAAALLPVACGPGSAAPAGAPSTSDGSDGSAGAGVVTVLAAASLTEPLTDLAHAYERAHPGVEVRTSFGSSTTLAQQVAAGAPADLLATAGTTALEQVPADERPRDRRTTIARNVLEVATPPDNPAHVTSLDDLARPSTDVVLCVSTTPCGAAADSVLRAAGVRAHVVSRETDVKATLTKVRLGEVDAALVYHSDVVSAGGDVHGVPVPKGVNETLTYPLLRLTPSPAAVAYARYLASDAGAAALARHGFLAP